MSGMLHGGAGDPRPVRGNNPTSLNEARNEMRRLTAMLLKANKAYLLREATVTRLHAEGRQNFSGDLVTVLGNDLALASLSGTSQVLSTLITALGTYIQAELAMKTFRLEHLQQALQDEDMDRIQRERKNA
jgi:hypothetical protein